MTCHGTIRVASANLRDGGLGPDGSTVPREQTAAALRDWQPHLVLVQELHAAGEELVRRHWRALANATGLEPCAIGLPRGSRRLRTGILADTSVLEILDDGRAPFPDAPFWAEAGGWLYRQQKLHENGRLHEDRVRLLRDLGAIASTEKQDAADTEPQASVRP
jgi:hypothetical protein